MQRFTSVQNINIHKAFDAFEKKFQDIINFASFYQCIYLPIKINIVTSDGMNHHILIQYLL